MKAGAVWVRVDRLVILKRLIAFPESRRILAIHLLASPFLALQWAALAMVPVLLRGHFHAGEWQTAMCTAAIPVMFMLSVAWNELYRRLNPLTYITIVWLIAVAPLGGIALCHRAESVLACVVTSAIGLAGMNPLNGDILRNCYPPTVRSKVYGVTQAIAQFTVMSVTYGIGLWLDLNNEAYRIYMPLSMVGIGGGMVLVYRITRHRLFQERLKHQTTETFTASLCNLYRNMIRVFREDPDFRRYEIAFFIYGLGWSSCQALLPFLVVDKLQFTYAEVAQSTQAALQVTLMLMILPTSHLMDRHGPVRLAMWGMALIPLYPIGLMLASGVTALTLITIWFAIGISAIHLAWTIGPITLAPSASDAPNYLAIHASLVGPRSIIGQFSAVGVYLLTGRMIEIPLAGAIVCFIGGALAMHRLDRHRKRALQVTGESISAPLSPSRAP